jgi:hypothetical protein
MVARGQSREQIRCRPDLSFFSFSDHGNAARDADQPNRSAKLATLEWQAKPTIGIGDEALDCARAAVEKHRCARRWLLAGAMNDSSRTVICRAPHEKSGERAQNSEGAENRETIDDDATHGGS